MCRLAYIPKLFKSLPQWLRQLEESFGGDGNGIAMGGELFKGLGMTVEACVNLMRFGPLPALWHTRKVSSGHKNDRLCHPFPCDGGWLAHNGHWQAGHIAAMTHRDINGGPVLSDTAFFALLVDRMGFETACDKYNPTGVWLFMEESGLLSVHKNGGSLHFCRKLGAWGSEPARQGKWIEVPDGWYGPGERPKPPKVFVTKTVPFWQTLSAVN